MWFSSIVVKHYERERERNRCSEPLNHMSALSKELSHITAVVIKTVRLTPLANAEYFIPPHTKESIISEWFDTYRKEREKRYDVLANFKARGRIRFIVCFENKYYLSLDYHRIL